MRCENTTIYALLDPRNNEVRYIGKTVQSLKERLRSHLKAIKRETNHRTNWLNNLVKCGVTPSIIELEVVSSEEWEVAEIFWISYLKFLGASLVNSATGGAGNSGFVMSEEQKQKLREINLGKIRGPCADETKAKISVANKGKERSDEHRQKLREANTGKKS